MKIVKLMTPFVNNFDIVYSQKLNSETITGSAFSLATWIFMFSYNEHTHTSR